MRSDEASSAVCLEELKDIQKLGQTSSRVDEDSAHRMLQRVMDKLYSNLGHISFSSSSIADTHAGLIKFQPSPQFDSFITNGVLSSTLEVTAECCLLHNVKQSSGELEDSSSDYFMERMVSGDMQLPPQLYKSVLKLLLMLAGLQVWIKQRNSAEDNNSCVVSPSQVHSQIMRPEAHIILLAAVSSFTSKLKTKSAAILSGEGLTFADGDTKATIMAEQKEDYFKGCSEVFNWLNKLAPLLHDGCSGEATLLNYRPFYALCESNMSGCSLRTDSPKPVGFQTNPAATGHGNHQDSSHLQSGHLDSEQSSSKVPHYDPTSTSSGYEAMSALLIRPLAGVSLLKILACLVAACAGAIEEALTHIQLASTLSILVDDQRQQQGKQRQAHDNNAAGQIQDILSSTALSSDLSYFRDASVKKRAVDFLLHMPETQLSMLLSKLKSDFKAVLSSPLILDIAAANVQGGRGVMRMCGGERLEEMSMKERNHLLRSVRSMVDEVMKASSIALEVQDKLLQPATQLAAGVVAVPPADRSTQHLRQEAVGTAIELLGIALDFKCTNLVVYPSTTSNHLYRESMEWGRLSDQLLDLSMARIGDYIVDCCPSACESTPNDDRYKSQQLSELLLRVNYNSTRLSDQELINRAMAPFEVNTSDRRGDDYEPVGGSGTALLSHLCTSANIASTVARASSLKLLQKMSKHLLSIQPTGRYSSYFDWQQPALNAASSADEGCLHFEVYDASAKYLSVVRSVQQLCRSSEKQVSKGPMLLLLQVLGLEADAAPCSATSTAAGCSATSTAADCSTVSIANNNNNGDDSGERAACCLEGIVGQPPSSAGLPHELQLLKEALADMQTCISLVHSLCDATAQLLIFATTPVTVKEEEAELKLAADQQGRGKQQGSSADNVTKSSTLRRLLKFMLGAGAPLPAAMTSDSSSSSSSRTGGVDSTSPASTNASPRCQMYASLMSRLKRVAAAMIMPELCGVAEPCLVAAAKLVDHIRQQQQQQQQDQWRKQQEHESSRGGGTSTAAGCSSISAQDFQSGQSASVDNCNTKDVQKEAHVLACSTLAACSTLTSLLKLGLQTSTSNGSRSLPIMRQQDAPSAHTPGQARGSAASHFSSKKGTLSTLQGHHGPAAVASASESASSKQVHHAAPASSSSMIMCWEARLAQSCDTFRLLASMLSVVSYCDTAVRAWKQDGASGHHVGTADGTLFTTVKATALPVNEEKARQNTNSSVSASDNIQTSSSSWDAINSNLIKPSSRCTHTPSSRANPSASSSPSVGRLYRKIQQLVAEVLVEFSPALPAAAEDPTVSHILPHEAGRAACSSEGLRAKGSTVDRGMTIAESRLCKDYGMTTDVHYIDAAAGSEAGGCTISNGSVEAANNQAALATDPAAAAAARSALVSFWWCRQLIRSGFMETLLDLWETTGISCLPLEAEAGASGPNDQLSLSPPAAPASALSTSSGRLASLSSLTSTALLPALMLNIQQQLLSLVSQLVKNSSTSSVRPRLLHVLPQLTEEQFEGLAAASEAVAADAEDMMRCGTLLVEVGEMWRRSPCFRTMLACRAHGWGMTPPAASKSSSGVGRFSREAWHEVEALNQEQSGCIGKGSSPSQQGSYPKNSSSRGLLYKYMNALGDRYLSAGTCCKNVWARIHILSEMLREVLLCAPGPERFEWTELGYNERGNLSSPDEAAAPGWPDWLDWSPTPLGIDLIHFQGSSGAMTGSSGSGSGAMTGSIGSGSGAMTGSSGCGSDFHVVGGQVSAVFEEAGLLVMSGGSKSEDSSAAKCIHPLLSFRKAEELLGRTSMVESYHRVAQARISLPALLATIPGTFPQLQQSSYIVQLETSPGQGQLRVCFNPKCAFLAKRMNPPADGFGSNNMLVAGYIWSKEPYEPQVTL
ncbi:hypothetical protein CEUSTIGMA_g5948.t1 [Chlamydomonas eustigma]|uniref:Uncharacterized protein n=1 Tax=Chlamydomonas eustigma TaxID=1157962 RepID=A0A250X6G0_9CHLO|nr:hypothetical protein CEUSTIGMA_g5948.t1 [Chlamydomonas eustigma]|eukprot:GAX78509.1 hypothetical protein CEUSTIGMA_g5948.t1 [Chlamydomonas eustigma]